MEETRELTEEEKIYREQWLGDIEDELRDYINR